MQSHHRSNAWNKDYLKVWWIEASRSQTTRLENALQILPLISGYGTRHHRHRLNIARSMGATYVPPPLQTFADLDSSERRRLGSECGSTCRSRCSPYHQTKTTCSLLMTTHRT